MVDAAQGIEAQTLANVHLALAQGLVIVPVINKIDLPSAQPDARDRGARERARHPARGGDPRLAPRRAPASPRCSRPSSQRVPPPKGDPHAPLQGLIFDSHYDPYKGVVAYVRLVAGTLARSTSRSA